MSPPHSMSVKQQKNLIIIHAYHTSLKHNYILGDNNDNFELIDGEDESECVLVKRDGRNLVYRWTETLPDEK